MISGHGNNISDYGTKIVCDFSSNVYNNPCTSEIIEHLKGELNSIRNYPDCNCTQLRKVIARDIGVNIDNVLMTNGSAEAFYLIAHAHKGACSVIPVPSFAEYEDACQLYGHSLEFIYNDLGLSDLKNKLLWLGNPNNPDGKYYSKSFLAELIGTNPDTLFIIDEAYVELCKGGGSIAPYINDFPNLLVIKSFTKRFAIPGIRLGYIVAPSALIQKIQAHHIPWAVNSLALKLGEYIMNDSACKNTDVTPILEDSQLLQREIDKIVGMNVLPSQTNYFLVQLIEKRASELKEFLVKEYGILIRDAANFRGLKNDWLRIASQGKENDSKLLIALKNWAKLL